MRNLIVRVGMTIAAMVLISPERAKADFIYTYDFEFDAVGNYAAAEFMAQSTSLLTQIGDTATILPPGDLNGFAVPLVKLRDIQGTELRFNAGFDFGSGGAPGDVVAFYFIAPGAINGVGTYTTTDAGRDIFIGSFGSQDSYQYVYTTGTLTISVTSVPEQSTLVMVGIGSALLLGWSRLRKPVPA